MKNSPARMALWSVIALCAPLTTPPASAQAPAGGMTESVPARTWSESDLDNLVASIALYPDDLLALVLPASTYPLDIVKADRFLERLKSNKNLQPDANLDPSVHNLLNYPEIVRKMSTDIDWTQQLGNAVTDDQGAVMEAIQRFRRKAYAAKNLKTDDKQTVGVEDEIISLQPTKPDVIYVPQYDPVTVVVEQPATYVGAPYWGYYPTAYPSYYYPYPPGYAFASGFFWGAVGAAWAMNWHGGYVSHHGDININSNRNNNVNIGDGNRGQGDRGNLGDRNQVNPNDRSRASDRSASRASDRSARTADRGAGGDRWQPDRSSRQGGGERVASRSQAGARAGDRGYSPRTASTFERSQAAAQFNRSTGAGSAANRGSYAGNRGSSASNRSGASASTRPSYSGGGSRSSSANRASSARSSYSGSSRAASSRGGGSMSRYSSGRSASAASSRGAASRGGGGRGGGGRGGGRR
jgi:hypothetical protein